VVSLSYGDFASRSELPRRLRKASCKQGLLAYTLLAHVRHTADRQIRRTTYGLDSADLLSIPPPRSAQKKRRGLCGHPVTGFPNFIASSGMEESFRLRAGTRIWMASAIGTDRQPVRRWGFAYGLEATRTGGARHAFVPQAVFGANDTILFEDATDWRSGRCRIGLTPWLRLPLTHVQAASYAA